MLEGTHKDQDQLLGVLGEWPVWGPNPQQVATEANLTFERHYLIDSTQTAEERTFKPQSKGRKPQTCQRLQKAVVKQQGGQQELVSSLPQQVPRGSWGSRNQSVLRHGKYSLFLPRSQTSVAKAPCMCTGPFYVL